MPSTATAVAQAHRSTSMSRRATDPRGSIHEARSHRVSIRKGHSNHEPRSRDSLLESQKHKGSTCTQVLYRHDTRKADSSTPVRNNESARVSGIMGPDLGTVCAEVKKQKVKRNNLHVSLRCAFCIVCDTRRLTVERQSERMNPRGSLESWDQISGQSVWRSRNKI